MQIPERTPGPSPAGAGRDDSPPGPPPPGPAPLAGAVTEDVLYAVITADHAGRILRMDPAAEQLFGYRPHEAVGRNIAELLKSPAPGGPHDQGLCGHLASGPGPAARRLEVRACRADGTEFAAEVVLLPLPAEGGPALAAYVRDLTEQKWAISALRRSEERCRDLVENANDIIYAHDLDGNLTAWNRAGEHLLGYTAQEARGLNIAQLVVPEQLEQARQMIRRKTAEGGRTVYELDVLAKDGRQLTVEINSRLIHWPGQPPQVQGMARDVTERKRAEEALKEVDRRKDEFLATLAHELRNPLAPLRNALEIMRLAADNPAAVRQARELMERQVQQLARLVDDLLDVSRIMRDTIELRKERVELAAVVARGVETARPVVSAHGHELAVCLSPEPIWLEADVIRLAQVLGNLLTNAAKYTERGGRIWLTAGQEGAEIVLRVRDTGIGIEPTMLPRLFGLFVQAERSLGRSQGGMGVGLALVRKLVGMHGGSVEARSEGLGHGSEFIVRLPAAARARQGDASSGAEGVVPPTPPARQRVLVVDDNRDAAESLAQMLRLDGHEVWVAHDGRTALNVALGHPPDLAFLDLGMPGMDGYELCRQMRSQPALAGALLVALTGWGQEEDRCRSQEAGFDRHLVKPAEPQSLRRLLAHPRLARP